MGKQTVGAEIQVYLYLILLPLDIYSYITPPFVSSLERETFEQLEKFKSQQKDTGTISNNYLVFSVIWCIQLFLNKVTFILKN